jgi:predicted GIY-YIG superfamily endonuclease
MESLYVLELDKGKYYVGKSADVSKRFNQHQSGSGSAWTKLHKPIRILETRPLTSIHDETNVTKDLMKKYGISNVRGGPYTAVELPVEQEDMIRHEMRAATDACYKCGKPGHFANRCTRKSSFTGTCGCGKSFLDFDEFLSHNRACIARQAAVTARTPKSEEVQRMVAQAIPKAEKMARAAKAPKEPGTCYRCGRAGHYSPACYARSHVNGYAFEAEDSDTSEDDSDDDDNDSDD